MTIWVIAYSDGTGASMGAQIKFEGLHNVRDLGGTAVADGLKVSSGKMLRSDQLADATETDLAKLGELGIGKIIDLRSAVGRDEKPDPDIAGAVNLHLPIIEDVRAGITRDSKSDARIIEMLTRGEDISSSLVDQHMELMYRRFVSDPFAIAQYTRFVDEIIESAERGEAVLWHCTAGKDRAGFATAIVLESLGASRDDIIEDYLITNEYLTGVVEHLLATIGRMLPSDSARQAARSFFRADERYLEAAYDEAATRFGSFEAFCEQALGIDAGKRAHMRELFCC